LNPIHRTFRSSVRPVHPPGRLMSIYSFSASLSSVNAAAISRMISIAAATRIILQYLSTSLLYNARAVSTCIFIKIAFRFLRFFMALVFKLAGTTPGGVRGLNQPRSARCPQCVICCVFHRGSF